MSPEPIPADGTGTQGCFVSLAPITHLSLIIIGEHQVKTVPMWSSISYPVFPQQVRLQVCVIQTVMVPPGTEAWIEKQSAEVLLLHVCGMDQD